MQNLAINSDRLWNSLMEMARIGATEKGGVNRQALTELDGQGRDLFVHFRRGLTAVGDVYSKIFHHAASMGMCWFANRPPRNRGPNSPSRFQSATV